MIFLLFLVLTAQSSSCAAVNEEQSVVSVYTTDPSSTGGHDTVYTQIASNIAEKISSPIYRLLGINKSNKTSDKQTERPFEHIELMNETDSKPNPRHKEQVSPDFDDTRRDKKPEKIVLYSSYIAATTPAPAHSPEEGEEFEMPALTAKPKTVFSYVFELVGSVMQLLWGGFLTMFVNGQETKYKG